MGTDDEDHYEGDHDLADYVGVYDGADTVNTYGGHGSVVAGDGDKSIDTGDGNDWLVGGDDFIVDDGAWFYLDQKIFGGAGNDQIVVRGGMTYIYSGSGDETFVFVRTGDISEAWIGVPTGRVAENEGGGHDTIILSTGWSGFVMSDNVEDLLADNSNAQDDRITWDNRLDDIVLGVEVTGNASHNSIKGSIVRDVLSGGVGNDTLDAHFGEGDRLYGGVGDDILILDFTRKAKLYGGADDDTMCCGSGPPPLPTASSNMRTRGPTRSVSRGRPST